MKPIIFNTEMVRAILDGRKTVTRRAVKPQPVMDLDKMWHWRDCQWMDGGLGFLASAIEDYAPYQLGQTLYVRETWCNYGELDDNDQVIDGTEQYYYRADGENPTPFNYIIENDKRRDYPIWHPSIHMPKKAARIFLRVKDVRVERLQNISGQDLSKEGICTREELCNGMTRGDFDGFAAFAQLWNRTIKKADLKTYGWDANPWVWVIEFEHIGKEGAESEKD